MFKVGAAQIQVINGDINFNIQKHLKWIDIAAQNELNAIVFPEMSLSGYDRSPSDNMIFQRNDDRLAPFIDKSSKYNMNITVSAPVVINDAYYITSFNIDGSGNVELYTKTYLHGGEDVFFTHGIHNPIISIGDYRASFAICADVSHEEHAQRAFDQGAQVYLVSAFVTEEGFEKDANALTQYSKEHGFLSVFSNFCGESFEWKSAGKSSVWSPRGDLLVQLSSDVEGIAEATFDGDWQGKEITEVELST